MGPCKINANNFMPKKNMDDLQTDDKMMQPGLLLRQAGRLQLKVLRLDQESQQCQKEEHDKLWCHQWKVEMVV